MKKNVSVIVPFFNEEENIDIFLNELNSFLSLSNIINNYEIICINDGSIDKTILFLTKFQNTYDFFSIINLPTNKGQSNAIYLGVQIAQYANIVTIDGDCQNDPKDIDKLLYLYFNEPLCDLVAGERIKRKDDYLKILSSKISNKFRNYIFKDGCKDSGCSLKIFKKNIFLSIPFFNGLHRFIPSLFVGFGYNVRYMDVNHRPRKMGKSKYGIGNRLFIGIRNMFIVHNIIKKKRK